MDEIQQLRSELEGLKNAFSEAESKVNDLYSRPLMPYSHNASSGDHLELGVDLRPIWVTPQ